MTRLDSSTVYSCGVLLISLSLGCGSQVDESLRVQGPIEKSSEEIEYDVDDWAVWRGPAGDNHARGETPPLRWSEKENVIWKSTAGEGHASPIVAGDAVFLPVADRSDETQSLLCLDRETGEQRWSCEVYRGALPHTHATNTHASATAATDGRLVYCVFLTEKSVLCAAVDLAGEIVWKCDAGPFRSVHGYGSSPVLYDQLVIVAGDSPAGGFLTALSRVSGEIVWRTPRPNKPSFGTPIVTRLAGEDQLLLNGQKRVVSYDPLTGAENWSAAGPSSTAANTVAWTDSLIIASGGYPQRGIKAIRADGSGQVAWELSQKAYVPSPLVAAGRLYALLDNGVLLTLDVESGKKLSQQRVSGNFSCSPVLSGDHLFFSNHAGSTFVYETGDRPQLVAENRVDDEGGYATPAICGGRLYLRTRNALYCIGS